MTFEDAVRKLLDVGPEYLVFVETEGGQVAQIGDCTWDTEGYTFTLTAYLPDPPYTSKSRTFDSLPDIWEALS